MTERPVDVETHRFFITACGGPQPPNTANMTINYEQPPFGQSGSPGPGAVPDNSAGLGSAAHHTAWTPPVKPPGSAPGGFPEPPHVGINAWVMKAACACRRAGMTAPEAKERIQACEPQLRRKFKPDEVAAAVAKVYSCDHNGRPPEKSSPKWPELNRAAQDKAIKTSPFPGLAELRAGSQPIPGEGVADHVVDALFPGNPLLCLGDSTYSFGTVRREDVRGKLTYVSFIVPSPMTATEGRRMSDGGLSAHTLDNTGSQKYLVCEFDGHMSHDAQAAIIGHLSTLAPLVCVCFSGSRSLHAWFRVEGHPEDSVLRFFTHAVSLGADPATWSPSQFCRLPGGHNHDKGAVQEVYYLNPGAELAELPEPSALTPGFQWDIQDGADNWTADAATIVNLSDPPLVDGLMRRCEVGTVVGAAKTAKTWFALFLALAVAMGTEFLGRRAHKARTLYLDYELKPNTFKKRMCMLASGVPLGFFYQCLRGCRVLPTIDQIAELIISRRIELLVVDSLYRTGWLTEENSNDSTGRELSQLQQLATRTGCTILVVDHTAKGGGSDRSAVDASRGASSKGGFFDFIFVLRASASGPDPDATYVTLDPVVRDWPESKNLPLVSFVWSPLNCLVTLAGEVPADDPHLLRSRIVDALSAQEAGTSIKQLMATLDVSETTLRRALEYMVAAGKVLEEPDPAHGQRKLFRVPAVTDAGAGGTTPKQGPGGV